MNRITVIGNLVRDPESKTTNNGKTVCSFTIAANRRRKVEGQPDADFFRVNAWGATGENCQKYLAKGRKVAVVGSVSVHAYTDKNNQPAASMDVFAEDVEFLGGNRQDGQAPADGGYTPVDPEGLPF